MFAASTLAAILFVYSVMFLITVDITLTALYMMAFFSHPIETTSPPSDGRFSE